MISNTHRAPEADLIRHFFSDRRMLKFSQDNKYEKICTDLFEERIILQENALRSKYKGGCAKKGFDCNYSTITLPLGWSFEFALIQITPSLVTETPVMR